MGTVGPVWGSVEGQKWSIMGQNSLTMTMKMTMKMVMKMTMTIKTDDTKEVGYFVVIIVVVAVAVVFVVVVVMADQ